MTLNMVPSSQTRRSTITDVARLAGVGKVTVSYVLSGQGKSARISEKTEQRVREAAAELNYRPNAVARMLVTRRTEMIAVVLQRGSYFTRWSGFTTELLRGVSTAAVERGYDIVLHTQEIAPDREADKLADGRVDGALVLRDLDDPVVNDLGERGFPCVRFFSRSDDANTAFVDADNYNGAKLAVQHLLDLGHRNIAMVRGGDRSSSSTDRHRAYVDLMDQQEDVQARVLQIFSGQSDFQPLRDLMLSEDPPTALFVWSDEVALGCMSVLREMAIRVPDDVSIVGFDSIPECARAVPPLTSVGQPVFEMAQEATRLLIDLISGAEVANRQCLFPLVLDVRGSTAAVRSQSYTTRWIP
ncbi:MAG: LacI family DNA-binding transcriptional regulator [Fimbriimonas sp.]